MPTHSNPEHSPFSLANSISNMVATTNTSNIPGKGKGKDKRKVMVIPNMAHRQATDSTSKAATVRAMGKAAIMQHMVYSQ